MVLGRAFCAWGCMFGAFQDFVSRLMAKLKIKPVNRKFGKWILWVIITVFIIGNLISGTDDWPTYYWFIAMAILAGLVLWMLIEKKPDSQSLVTLPKYIWFAQYLGGVVFWWITLNAFQKGFTFAFQKFGILDNEPWASVIPLAILIAITIGMVEKRVFCKYLCPIGLLLRFVSAIPFPKKYKVRATDEKCSKCGKCNKECLMGIKPMDEINQYGLVRDSNCINCLVCVSVCPKNAIDFKNKSIGYLEKQILTRVP